MLVLNGSRDVRLVYDIIVSSNNVKEGQRATRVSKQIVETGKKHNKERPGGGVGRKGRKGLVVARKGREARPSGDKRFEDWNVPSVLKHLRARLSYPIASCT